jgi:hypothetical protein
MQPTCSIPDRLWLLACMSREHSFVRLRQMLVTNAEPARKLAAMEKKYDSEFKAVFAAIRELMAPAEQKKKRPIGFSPWE